MLVNKETACRRPPCLVGGWFHFQDELDSAHCESSHCTESQTHPDLSEPDQRMLCLPIPPSLGRACTTPSLPGGSFYHVPGVLSRARACVRVAGSLQHWLTPSHLHTPPHTLPSSQTTNTPTQHRAGANTCIFSMILLHFSAVPPARPGCLSGDTGWESRELGLSSRSAPNP